ncbi:MAG: TolC family protein [Deltaproteobacteria bacterium]|nr:TolC family protein [Deltaproteobacteria bacterium]
MAQTINSIRPIIRAFAAFLLIAAMFKPQAFASDQSESILTLSHAVKEALENNPELKALRDAAKAGMERAKAEGYLDDPVLRVMLEEIPKDKPFGITPGNAMATRYSISQMLPYPGKLGLKQGIALKEALLINARVSALELEKVFMAKEAYYDYVYSSLSIHIMNEIREVLSYMGKIAESKYAAGTATQQDVIKLNLEASMASSEIISLTTERSIAEARLKAVMYRPLDEALPEPEAIQSKAGELKADEDLKRPVDALPDIQMALLEAEAAALSKELAEKNYYPDFMIGAGPVQKDGEVTGFDVMFQMNIPVWFGKYRMLDNASAAGLSSQRLRLASVRNTKALEIKEAVLQLRAALETQTLYDTTLVKQASLSFESALKNYQSGKGDLLMLLDTERELKKIRLAALNAAADYWKKAAALEKAAGRGYIDTTGK